jgi:hypothetical protein
LIIPPKTATPRSRVLRCNIWSKEGSWPTKLYPEEQIIAVLKESEAGAKTTELCRKYGMSDLSAIIAALGITEAGFAKMLASFK